MVLKRSGALDLEAVHVPFEIVVLVHLQQVGGDHLRLGADLAPRHGRRGAGTGVEREP